MTNIKASLTDEIVGHRTRFLPKLSPATPRRSKWAEPEEEEVDRFSYLEGESAIKPTQIQTEEENGSRRFTLPPSALTSAQRKELSRHKDTSHPIDAVRENLYKLNIANVIPTNPNSLPLELIPEHDYLLLDKNISAEQWAIYGLNVQDDNHVFKTARPLSRGEVRTLTIHQNLGQNLYVSPTTLEDTLDMARTGWARLIPIYLIQKP